MNVVVVDDEVQIRKWFHILLLKTGLPLQIAGSCGNGKEALELCRASRIDLIITDIKMPVMDGIELIQHLKSEFPAIRVLILSAYGEFHYASEALKAGASEYILKAEVTVESLKEAVLKVMGDIDTEKKRVQEVDTLKSTLNENQNALRALYFTELLRGVPTAIQEFDNKMGVFKIALDKRHITLMAVCIDDYRNTLKTARIKTKELLDMAMVNIMDETLQNEANGGCSLLFEQGVYVVLVNTPGHGGKSAREATLRYAHRISNHLYDFIGVPVSIGISLTYNDLSLLGRQYSEAYEALSKKQFYGRRSVVWYEDVEERPTKKDNKELNAALSEWSHYLDRGDYELARRYIQAFMEDMGRQKHIPEQELKMFCLESVFLLLQNLRRKLSQGMNEAQAAFDTGLPQQEISQLSSFHEVKEWILLRIGKLLEEAGTSRQGYSEAIRKTCDYIYASFSEEISLQYVAELVHLNKTYLSELFKKETGTSFNDFLTQVRIEKAKELILAGEVKMGAMAEQVGYPDGSYFTKVFKKVTGMTPMEFKQSGGRLKG
ncbi:response regulator [Paenibacillus radicis (ex Xue et al. 2023)]|uniref:Response regulator n=1 Tax=Paenibacillus radicis (ex Xue et al. 2023) TaxID=2972489 RepID=A0ABT1YCP1_9BACL|nr:response regulator [Paenibacillus radicis (ex Xue et al. 2023)]MCR8629983.1 response regulator [Paenibacillus radicis (ex Xue et al. 2023)]